MDRLWWNHITKAHKFIEDLAAAAVEGKSILLSLPRQVPWRETLLELVGDRLKMETPNNTFEAIACPEEEVGLFLLNHYCRSERRATYRYGKSYAAFLGECEDTVLNDRYLWIFDIPKEKYEEWLDFITEYNQNVTVKTPAVFILETSDPKFANQAKKGIKKIAFDQNIGAYDKFAFCALAATENHCKEYLRPYLAELAALVCSEDVELCAQCVCAGSEFLRDPRGVIEEITSQRCRSDGEPFQFDKSAEEVERLVWETQLKNIFPVIERYRSRLIRKYRKPIQGALPINNPYGEKVIHPEEVEVGMLVYLAGSGVISLNAAEYEELVQFREARNKLAHFSMLEFETADAVLHKAESL